MTKKDTPYMSRKATKLSDRTVTLGQCVVLSVGQRFGFAIVDDCEGSRVHLITTDPGLQGPDHWVTLDDCCWEHVSPEVFIWLHGYVLRESPKLLIKVLHEGQWFEGYPSDWCPHSGVVRVQTCDAAPREITAAVWRLTPRSEADLFDQPSARGIRRRKMSVFEEPTLSRTDT